jgi:hypothetical protein
MAQATLLFQATLYPEAPLGDQIIPAVPGEFYAYSSYFTEEKSVYTLLKCKSNKCRKVADMHLLGSDVNLIFTFHPFQLYSIKGAVDAGLINTSFNTSTLDDTWVAPANISAEDFYNIWQDHDETSLKTHCLKALGNPENRMSALSIKHNDVIAMMTGSGKYGMFVIKELRSEVILIDACHILLQ